MLTIRYTNTTEETKHAFMRFQRRYALRRAVIMTVPFLIAAALGIDMIVKNPNGYPGYILTALGLAMAAVQIIRPRLVWDRLRKTLEGLNEESYEARFYDDRIEVETQILPASEEAEKAEETELIAITRDGINTVENPSLIEEYKNKEKEKTETSVIGLGTEELLAEENEETFLLFVNRGLIYVFPKRCMGADEINELRNYFTEKAIL